MRDTNHVKESSQKHGKGSPHTGQRAPEFQTFGTVVKMPHGLPTAAVQQTVTALNQILADTITLRDLYKKHHWQVAGPAFYQFHLLFDKHYEEQATLVDSLAERIQLLGGVSLAMAADIAETTRIERPPRGREPVAVQLSRLLDAHGVILKEARAAADLSDEHDDHGTNDLLVSRLIPANEFQIWFISQHLVEVPAVDSAPQRSAVA
jgi:starvation-inducible DNA-binding protein